MRAVPEFRCLSSSTFSNIVLRRNILWVAPSVWRPPMFTPKLITAGVTTVEIVLAKTPRPRCRSNGLLGGSRSACGHVDSGMYLASEFAERYVTGRVPVRVGSAHVVCTVLHMSNSTSYGDPEAKYSDAYPVAS
eukprot:3633271-Pyramimonas_sp.AAC.1